VATHKFQADQITECRFWLWCTVIVLLTTFFFGLRFKGYSIENDARLLPHNGGLDFHGNGIAYTGGLGDAVKIFDKNFSIEIALLLRDPNSRKFRIILIFHGGDDRKQLIIGQWRDWIIIMNGDDYDHSRNTKRIAVRIKEGYGLQEPVFLAITSDEDRTRVFLDGRLLKEKQGLQLHLPQSTDTRLIVGSDVYGEKAWDGIVFGLSFYGRMLSAKEIKADFRQWKEQSSFGFAVKAEPAILYLFQRIQNNIIPDHGQLGLDLKIPRFMYGLRPDFFKISFLNLKGRNLLSLDSIINFIGFMPLGFTVLSLFLARGTPFKRAAMAALIFCFLVSLSIELAQAWIPSRSSDAVDVFFNTLGALFGIALWKKAVSVFSHFNH